MLVKKKDGRLVEYDDSKVLDSIKRAAIAAEHNNTEIQDRAQQVLDLRQQYIEDGYEISEAEELALDEFDADGQFINGDYSEYDHDIAIELTNIITDSIDNIFDDVVTTSDIQKLIENVLLKNGHRATAKSYMRMMSTRDRHREMNTELMRSFESLSFNDSTSIDLKRENANIDGNSSMGMMLKYGSEGAKRFNLLYLIPPEISQAHQSGLIHIHDLDFYSLTETCCQIPLDKLFKHGFSTGHGFLRPPSNIRSYASLACIAIQSNQNDQHGGQSVPSFDYYMAPGVSKTFVNNIKQIIEIKQSSILDSSPEMQSNFDEAIHCLKQYVDKHEEIMNPHGYKHIHEILGKYLGLSDASIDEIIKLATVYADKETYQAMEALVHNLNTMNSRAGSQVPFSSINFGTDTSTEGRMVSRNFLLATEAGLGNGETAVFPVSIFKMKSGVNYNKDDPNYDLFKLACQVSAKRLFPNFGNLDAPFNLRYYKEGDKDTEVAYMGCIEGMSSVYIKSTDTNGYEAIDIYSMENLWNKLTSSGFRVSKYNESEYIDLSAYNYSVFDGGLQGLYTIEDNPLNEVFKTPMRGCEGDTALLPHHRPGAYTKIKKLIKNPNKHNWVRITLDNKAKLHVTTDHPFVVFDETIRMVHRVYTHDLSIGDKLVRYNQSKEKDGFVSIHAIESIEPIILDSFGYDFETESDMFIFDNTYSHNCRTRVIANAYDPSYEKVTGRGNLSFTSINLPRLGIESGGDLDKFYSMLDDTMELVHRQLLARLKVQCMKHPINYPFLMGNGVWHGSEKLGLHDDIDEILRHGTLTVGFIGLAETLIALIGKHHGESDEAQQLGLEIIGHMRKTTDRWAAEEHLNYSIIGTPAEGLAGRFVRIDRKRYGVIPGITDKEYYVNSSHIPVNFPISAFKKIDLEAPYHELCNGGHIAYIEMDGDTAKNVQAFEQIVRYMHDKGIGYGAINHPVDYDPVCNYVGVINDVCPRCGRKEFEAMSEEMYTQLRKKYRFGNMTNTYHSGDANEEQDRISNGFYNPQ